MRICHVITTLVFGGAERLLLGYANIQAPRHSVHVVYLKGDPVLARDFHPSIVIHHIPLNHRAPRRLRALLKELRPDVLHTQLGHADLLGLWAARGLRMRKFCTMQNIWFKWNWMDYVFFAIYRVAFATVARDCKVICISKSVETHVRGRLAVPASRTRLLYNCIPKLKIDEPASEIRARLGIPLSAFVVLFVGRLRIQKSVETLLMAAASAKASIPNIKILLVGEGPERDQLERVSDRLGISECVEFRGTTANPEFFMAAADIFALPSIFEGFGMVVIEAFRAGIAVIASEVEGPKELIENDRNGLLFPPRDHERLAECIIRLYKDSALRNRLAIEGKASFSEIFTIDFYADELEKLYVEWRST